jgi:ketosteroid isomerase-like protein
MSDESEILRTVAEYCHAIDERGGAGLADLFTEDAEFTMMGDTLRGRDAIAARFSTTPGGGPSGIVHLAANPILDVTGDTATGIIDHLLLRRGDDGTFSVLIVGRWVDRYARAGNRWCIAERCVELPYGAVPLPGRS